MSFGIIANVSNDRPRTSDGRKPARDAFPSQSALHLPLLCAIAIRGGSIVFSIDGDALEASLADEFGLSRECRERTDRRCKAKHKRVWRNLLQLARKDLVELGMLDNSERDVWSITALGRAAIGESPSNLWSWSRGE